MTRLPSTVVARRIYRSRLPPRRPAEESGATDSLPDGEAKKGPPNPAFSAPRNVAIDGPSGSRGVCASTACCPRVRHPGLREGKRRGVGALRPHLVSPPIVDRQTGWMAGRGWHPSGWERRPPWRESTARTQCRSCQFVTGVAIGSCWPPRRARTKRGPLGMTPSSGGGRAAIEPSPAAVLFPSAASLAAFAASKRSAARRSLSCRAIRSGQISWRVATTRQPSHPTRRNPRSVTRAAGITERAMNASRPKGEGRGLPRLRAAASSTA